VTSVVLIGEAADEIAATLDGPGVERASSMDEAVEISRRHAKAGDVVLLSPGCASFDMFDSAEQRGDAFARAAAGEAAGVNG
jgi:UDP-N-acetylmuramoylalanine--D-glutamate ligase